MTPPGGPAYERAVVEDLNMVPPLMSTSASPAGRAAADLEPGAREASLAAQAARVSGPAPDHEPGARETSLAARRPEFRAGARCPGETRRQGDTSAATVIGALSKGVLRT